MAALRLFIAVSCVLIIQINAYPNGAPTKACVGSMKPKHHKAEPQPDSTSPILKFEAKWNVDNKTMNVTVESKTPLKGIFIQGRVLNATEPIGTFVNIPSETHLVKCSSGDGITHNSPQKWKKLDLTWQKPESMNTTETIQFWATVLVDFKTFWIVKSIEKSPV